MYQSSLKSQLISPDSREVLIYHELGHCRLGRGHDNSKENNARGAKELSILNERLISGDQYKRYRNEYLTELFKRDKTLIRAALLGSGGQNQ